MSLITVAMESPLGFLDHREGHVLVAVAIQRVHDPLENAELDGAVALDRRRELRRAGFAAEPRELFRLLAREQQTIGERSDLEPVTAQRIRHGRDAVGADD